MSAHHDHNDHHVSESKPVPFLTPLILGLVTMLVILAFVSLGNPSHCCKDGECCKKEAVSGHESDPEHGVTPAAVEEAHENKAVEEPNQTHSNTPKEETGAQEEAHH